MTRNSDSKFKGIEVTPKKDEHPEKMIKRFMKKVRNEGVIQELYDRRFFEKPSVKRRRKNSRAIFMSKMAEKDDGKS